MKRSVSSATNTKYSRYGDIFDEYVRRQGLESNLKGLSDHRKAVTMAEFIRHLCVDLGWSASATSHTVCGIKFILRSRLQSTAFLSDPIVSMAVASSKRMVSGRVVNLGLESRKKDPFTIDMVDWLRQQWLVKGNNIIQRMTYLGIAFGFNFMCRVGEFTRDKRSDHHLRRCDVTFTTAKGRVVSAEFIIRTSKTDQRGKGRWLYLGRRTMREAQLLLDLWDWVHRAGMSPDDPLFSRTEKRLNRSLTRKEITEAIKFTARNHGLSCKGFSTRSLRVGGENTCVAAGIKMDEIARIGGWAGSRYTSDRAYTRVTKLDRGALAVEESSRTLTASHLLTRRTAAANGGSA